MTVMMKMKVMMVMMVVVMIETSSCCVLLARYLVYIIPVRSMLLSPFKNLEVAGLNTSQGHSRLELA